MNSIQTEIGSNWKEHCYLFLKGNILVGLAIPLIEMGTTDEGRLFYFGVVPDYRGMGVGTAIHREALRLLKQKFQASYYVGSTDILNMSMIRVFERNGCILRDQKGRYIISQSV